MLAATLRRALSISASRAACCALQQASKQLSLPERSDRGRFDFTPGLAAAVAGAAAICLAQDRSRAVRCTENKEVLKKPAGAESQKEKTLRPDTGVPWLPVSQYSKPMQTFASMSEGRGELCIGKRIKVTSRPCWSPVQTICSCFAACVISRQTVLGERF